MITFIVHFAPGTVPMCFTQTNLVILHNKIMRFVLELFSFYKENKAQKDELTF